MDPTDYSLAPEAETLKSAPADLQKALRPTESATLSSGVSSDALKKALLTQGQSLDFPVKLDLTPPSLRVLSFQDNQLTLMVTDDNSGVQSVAIYDDQGKPEGILGQQGETQLTLTVDLSNLTQGHPKGLHIEALDFAFNQSAIDFELYIDPPFVSGYPDGSFRPDNRITRGEAVTLLYNLCGEKPKDLSVLEAFPDIPGDHWAAWALAWGIESKLISGDLGAAAMRPNDPILRSELASILAQLDNRDRYTRDRIPLENPPSFRDTSDNWAAACIAHLANYGILSGYGNQDFRPNEPIKRSETVTAFSRLVGRQNAYLSEICFSDVPEGHWAYSYIMNAANGWKE